MGSVTPNGTPRPVRRARKPRVDTAAAKLDRVQAILERTCTEDGQGTSLQESARRKAYRAGINAALDELRDLKEGR